MPYRNWIPPVDGSGQEPKLKFTFQVDHTQILWDNKMTAVTVETPKGHPPKGVYPPPNGFSLWANYQRWIASNQKAYAADLVDVPRPLWNKHKK
eukprot:g16621.t1